MSTTTELGSAVFPERCDEYPAAGLLPRTRAGRTKRRLTFEDKLRLLDPVSETEVTLERLMAFMNLFAFRTTGGIITRARGGPRDWAALRAPISPEHVARHLLADRLLPVFRPQWVGSRCPSTSKVVTLDVDADRAPDPILTHIRGLSDIHFFGYRDLDRFLADLAAAKEQARRKLPFLDRCLHLERALRRLGIEPDDPRQVLKQPTPSGGLHYTTFLDAPYFLYQIYDLLLQAGLSHLPGQIEFFPSKNRALRLPFGHVPGRPHDPRAWVEFIDAYLDGRIRRHSLESMCDRLRSDPPPEAVATARSGQLFSSRTCRRAAPVQEGRTAPGLPKPRRPERRPREACFPGQDVDRYVQLIEDPITSFADAEELFDLGILLVGTRTAALKRLAAHLIWFRHQSAEEATETLARWARDPRHQSKDIQDDLARGTDLVAKQIAFICRWYARNKRTAPPADRPDIDPRAYFAPAELDALLPAIQSAPVSERTDLAHFFLNFLAFARKHGRSREDGSGWEVAVAINAVIRKWPGCRGKDKYKIRMDRAKASGLLTMTRDKWQRPGGNGRARTYLLSIPRVDRPGWTVSYPDALSRLTEPTTNPESLVHPAVTDNPTPRSPADERPYDPTGMPATFPARCPDPRSLYPGGTGGRVDSRPPQRPPEPAPPETLPDRDHEAVPAALPANDRGPGRDLAGIAGQFTPSPIIRGLDGTIAEAVPLVGPAATIPELSPRLRMILAKSFGQLSPKEGRLALDFLSRLRQRGQMVPDGLLIRLRQKAGARERARPS
jgi:hypothetical protein